MLLVRSALPVVALLAACASGSPTPSADLSSGTDLPAVTWTSFAQSFFQRYCVSCHSPGGQGAQQNFNLLSVVQANSAHIRCGVAPAGMLPAGCSGSPAAGQFPIGNGPKPTDAERLTLVAWIEAGAPLQ